MTSLELQTRFRKFAYSIAGVCSHLPPGDYRGLSRNNYSDLLFFAASNYRASCIAQSRKAFKSKISIAFEEIHESLFWLEGIRDLKLINEPIYESPLKEAGELTRILAASRLTLENKKRKQQNDL